MKYTPKQYAEALAEIMDAAPRGKGRATIARVVEVLALHGALSSLRDIMREFLKTKEPRIVAVAPERNIEARVKRFFGTRVHVVMEKNEAIRGGLLLRSEDVRVDNTIARRLRDLRAALTK